MAGTSYGTVAEAMIYHADHGQGTEWSNVIDQDAALLRGSEYVDQRYRFQLQSGRWVSLFPGEPAGGRSQVREWPRTDAEDYDGNAISDSTVPDEVKNAAYEAALIEGTSPGTLSPQYIPADQVRRETVGPITVEYVGSKGGMSQPNRPFVPKIQEILSPVLTSQYAAAARGDFNLPIGVRVV